MKNGAICVPSINFISSPDKGRNPDFGMICTECRSQHKKLQKLVVFEIQTIM